MRLAGDRPQALAQLAEIERIDPTNRTALAERHSLGGDAAARKELGRLLGGQSQEALEESLFYSRLERWSEAAELLRMVETDNHDPFGTPPEFYYTFAYYLKRAGASSEAAECLRKARAARGRVDRFPYRAETEAPLAEALKADPGDGLARFLMGCLLYHLERPAEAIEHWEAAVRADQRSFPARRALGLAYAEQGLPVEAAAAQLEAAVEINPAHVQTFNDLSSLYARAGRFDEQLLLVKKALARSPQDDNLAEAVLTASLAKGRYDEAEKLVTNHRFAPRHRVYTLRDKYRILRFGQAAAAYHRSDFSEALRLFESAMKPPVSLGVDDFASQSTPRMEYYAGRVLDALGKGEEARQAYRRAIQGIEHLSGDRDSLNSENFHMVLALDRLGRGEEAARIEMRMVAFARAELDSKVPRRRAEARYLLALAQKRAGRGAEARRSMEEAIGILPDFLLPRLELRGDVLDPLR